MNPVGEQAAVSLDDGQTLHADLCVVATGHGLSADTPQRAGGLRTVYPLPGSVGGVPDRSEVAVIGTGLSAMDLIAEFTVGRGGRFDGVGASRRYLRSGREPRITLVNRSGWLPAARPALRRGRTVTPPTHLTDDVLRHTIRSRGRLDLDRDVWPLIRQEMLMRSAASANPAPPALIDEVLSTEVGRFPDVDTYGAAVRFRARRDLVEAELGLGASGLKEAFEVLRDHREILRTVVAEGNLDETQRALFFSDLVGQVNRLAIGPQRERIHECLLLEHAGIVRFGPGPAPELRAHENGWELVSTRLERPVTFGVDHVFGAHLHWPPAPSDDQALWQTMAEWARLESDRIALDPLGHPIAIDGSPEMSVAIIGPPAEGASYYNHYVPSPGVPCRIRSMIDRLVDHTESTTDRRAVRATNP